MSHNPQDTDEFLTCYNNGKIEISLQFSVLRLSLFVTYPKFCEWFAYIIMDYNVPS